MKKITKKDLKEIIILKQTFDFEKFEEMWEKYPTTNAQIITLIVKYLTKPLNSNYKQLKSYLNNEITVEDILNEIKEVTQWKKPQKKNSKLVFF